MISLPPKGDTAKKLGSNFAPLKVEALAIPGMTVRVSEGGFWTADNEFMEYIGGTSPNISAPGSDAKWVLITVTNTGMLNVVDGVASGTPELPLPSTYKDELVLCAIFLGDTTTAITNEMIYDLRPLWAIPPDSVSQDQLNNFATITYVDNQVATKAGVAGTGNANFTLNVGGSSINDSGIYVDRFSGPDVAIRFNELSVSGSPPSPSPGWEFTNDGSTYNPIGVSSGSYYTKTDLDNGGLDFLYYTQNDLTNGTPGLGVLDSRYYEQADADTTFAQLVHTHVVGDITGLTDPVETVNGIVPTLGNVSLGLDELTDVTISGTTTAAVIRFDGAIYRNALLQLTDLSDATISAPVLNDALMYNGSVFLNRPLIKSDISDLTLDIDYVSTGVNDASPKGTPQDIFGTKTFKDGVIIETSLTVSGTNTSIETADLKVTDQYIDINFGETGSGVDNGTGVSGIRIDRGPNTILYPQAIIQWDEPAQTWLVGTVGDVSPILTGAHTHTASQVTDFGSAVVVELGVNDLDAIGDIDYISPPSNGDYLRFGTSSWENKDFATDVTTELNTNNLNQMQDVTYLGSPALTAGDFLQWTGTEWVNHVAVKTDISDFVEADYLHVTGDETKTGDLTINGDFTVGGGTGTITTINSETFNILDSVITLNAGETGNGVNGGTGTSGLQVDRGGYSDAMLWWSEPAGTWLAHYSITGGSPPSPSLNVGQISFTGHNHVVADIIDLSVSASEINTLAGINTGLSVQAQLNDKISRTGDAMDAAVNLSFSAGGEVLGLPAVPSATGATSKEYVDTHIVDFTVHIDAAQNTFLDDLALPTLTGSEVNQLTGISGNVQTLLDTKTDKLIPAVNNNLAGLDFTTGNIVDSGVVVNDSGSLVSELWTADKIDTTKADKLVPALTNNLAGLDASGNLTDSGLILNDSGILVSELWTADKIDTTKADKVSGAVAGNFAGLDASGNLTDSGNNFGTFAPIVHLHVSSDITDWSAAFTTELGGNSIDALSDVNIVSVADGYLLHSIGGVWQSAPPTAISGFVRATGSVAETVTGVKTFSDNAFFQQDVTISQDLAVSGDTIINGDLTVSGTQIVQGTESVTGNTITLNYGSNSPITANGGGVILQRDTTLGSPPVQNAPDAVITWDHGNTKWQAGLDNALENVALENVTVSQPFYEWVSGLAPAGSPAGTVYNLNFGVPTPVAGQTGIQVFVNGVKQIEGAIKAYMVDYSNPAQTVVTFNFGEEPLIGADVEFYGFGYIG